MKKWEQSKKQIIIICCLGIVILAAAVFINRQGDLDAKQTVASPGAVVVTAPAVAATTPAMVVPAAKRVPAPLKHKFQKSAPTATPKPTPNPTPTPTPVPTPVPTPSVGADKTDRIASYYQGSISYKSKLTWSGDWGKKKFKKKKFGSFGCGFCCLANVYCSLSPYRCSPLDMLEYAKETTSYSGSGAIEWWDMKTILAKAGCTSQTGKKPQEYEEFQKIVADSKAVIVLVSNHAKKSMWENTTGHYVTLFLYDKKTDQVFLADSGSCERNRQWVPLEKVYQSLKKKSSLQYLAVTGYSRNQDTWKNKEFTGECIFPANWLG